MPAPPAAASGHEGRSAPAAWDTARGYRSIARSSPGRQRGPTSSLAASSRVNIWQRFQMPALDGKEPPSYSPAPRRTTHRHAWRQTLQHGIQRGCRANWINCALAPTASHPAYHRQFRLALQAARARPGAATRSDGHSPQFAMNIWQRFQMPGPTYDADRICRVSMASALGLGTSGGRCGCILGMCHHAPGGRQAFDAAWASYCEPSATPPQASKVRYLSRP
jgi:hypothetical protein